MGYDEPLITVRKDGRRYVRISTLEYINLRVDRSAGVDACWSWTANRNKKGYGICTSRSRRDSSGSQMAHRISYEIAKGSIPSGMFVLHRCDNPPCCNPKHLYVGTAAQNTADMVQRGRGRYPVGIESPAAKLTDQQVVEIRRAVSSGEMQAVVAAHFGVSAAYVSRLASGDARKHAPLLDDSGNRVPYIGEASG